MINNEMNENIVEPLTIGDNSQIDVPEDEEIVIGYSLERMKYSDNALRADIVWNNGMQWDNALASQEDNTYGLDPRAADDFSFVDDTLVGAIQYIMDNEGEHSACIEFFEDDGGLPGDLYAGPFCLEQADYSMIAPVDPWVNEYIAPFDAVEFNGGETYWVTVYGNYDYPPQAFLAAHSDNINLSQCAFKSSYFGFPNWVPGEDVFGIPYDVAFILYGVPEHDISVTNIISPIDEQELCECLPVSVEVSNFGASDEENVPVTIDIRNALFDDSFEDPINVVWKRDCGKWDLSMTDTGNPSVATPLTGNYMAQFKSGQGTPLDCMLYEKDYENFENLCNPMMSFYMWHDTYGSDDYLEVWVDPGTSVFEFVAGPFERLCCPGCPQGWIEHIVDLGDYAGLPFVRVGFMGYSDGVNGAYNLHIDDVSKYDLEYYAETEIDIASGETVVVEFAEDWCPCGWGEIFNSYVDFDLIACAKIDGDEVPANDCLDDVVTVYFPFEEDVAAIEITEPVAADPGPYEMCGIIKNVGQVEMSCFKAKMRVYDIVPGALAPVLLEEFNDAGWPLYDFPPAGWTVDGSGHWRAQTSSWYGNTQSMSGLPNAMFYWSPSETATPPGIQMITPPIDMAGKLLWQVEFDHYINDWSGGYTLELQASTDLVNWVTIADWPGTDMQPGVHETISGDYGVGGDVYFAWSFAQGATFSIDYWGVDDILISAADAVYTTEIYYDEVCIEYLDVCQEETVCFEDFTPPQPWPDCDTVKYGICLEVNPCDPLDDNPLNNKICEIFTVEFYRDILVQSITGPCEATSKGDVIYSQFPVIANAFTSDAGAGYLVQDDFFGLTDAIGGLSWWGITWFWTGSGWTPGTPDDMEFEVKFYDDAGGSPGAEVWSDTFGPSDYTREDYLPFSTDISYMWTVEIAPCANVEPGWLSIQATYDPDGDYFLWLNSDQGNLNALQNGAPISPANNVAFNLTACDSAAPPVDCYIPCGEADIIAVIENAGTHDEIVDLFVELQEFITDPEVGTTVLTATLDNVAIASGATYEANFGTYDFADSGVYLLIISAPLAGDCDTDNNEMSIGIGVDCCPPVSMHYPDPLYPNGENNWYTRSVDVEITASDPLCPDPCLGTSSGMGEIHYIVDGGSEVIVPGDTAEFKLTSDGVHLVEYWAVDAAGNVEDPFTFEIAIDKTAPSISLLYNVYQDEAGAWHVDFTAALGEATSGGNRVEFYIGSGLEKTDSDPPYEWSIDWIDDYKTVTFKAVGYDNAGNDGEDTVPGSEIAEEITAHSHAHQYIKSKTLSVLHKQLPRSR
jgi:hypothetical protein